ncbi:MAG: hypothetical protein IT292_10925 [Deltaproteobacteria bacterium]|nr:hypothetical protein [Deltaproteobacteria bacterium]
MRTLQFQGMPLHRNILKEGNTPAYQFVNNLLGAAATVVKISQTLVERGHML